MKQILCLDLGTQLGWAIRTCTGFITSGTLDLRGSRYEGGGARFLKLEQRLKGWHANPGAKIDVCYFEEVRRHLSTDSAHLYGGYLAVVSSHFEHFNVPYIGVPVGTIKKHATGRGNANKELMIEAARRRGHHPADDNEADALAILYWAIEQEGRENS